MHLLQPMQIKYSTFPCVLAVLISVLCSPLFGQAVSDERYREVAGQFRCPTCTGLSVLESDAPFSVQIQSRVRAMLEEGKTAEEIESFFLSKYGPWILRAPPKEGFGLMAWVLPLFFLLAGFVFLGFVFLQKKRQGPSGPKQAVPSESSQREKLMGEFDRLVGKNEGDA